MSPSSPKQRIGFVGHGVHACANLYPSISLTGNSVTSVATRSLTTAKAAAQAVHAENYHADVGVMLNRDNLDVVFVSVGPDDQARLTEQCLQAGVPVFVEKPLGMSAPEARRVAKFSEACGVPVMVGFMKRFAPAYRALADISADRSKFGRILVVDAKFSFKPWSKDLRNDSFLKLGAIHIVDLLRALFGEVSDVRGFSGSIGADIGMVFSMQFEGGHVATVNLCGVPAWAREHERVTVTGSKGWAEVEDLSAVRYHFAAEDHDSASRWQMLDEQTTLVTSVNSPMSGGARDLYLRGFVGEVQHFLDQIARKARPEPSAQDNVATMELCDRMIEVVPT